MDINDKDAVRTTFNNMVGELLQHIISAIKNKQVKTETFIAVVTNLMIMVETYKVSGLEKRDAVIETIKQLVELPDNCLPGNITSTMRNLIENKVVLSAIIASIIDASKNINVVSPVSASTSASPDTVSTKTHCCVIM